MIVVFSTLTGISMSLDLKKKCETADLLCRLADEVALLLDFRLTSTQDILTHLNRDERFDGLDFIHDFNIEKKSPVHTNLERKDNEELSDFLYSIGTTDLENQLRITEGYKAFANTRKAYYQQEYEKRRKLYSAFGLSGGMVIALLLA